MKSLLSILIVLGVAACGAIPIDASKARFAAKPTDAEAMQMIRAHLANTLIDPDSLRLKCSSVRKGWGRHGALQTEIFGWTVYCEVNAKNKFGGYTGGKPHLFIINGSTFTVIDTPSIGDGSTCCFGLLES